MKAEKWFNSLIEKYEEDAEFRLESLIIDFTEKIVTKMAEGNISRVELARRLGVSKAFVTKLLNGNQNLTIKSMLSIADALECEVNLDIYPKEFEVRNFYLHVNRKVDVKQFTRPVKAIIGEETDARAA